jgi:hypothetical protein
MVQSVKLEEEHGSDEVIIAGRNIIEKERNPERHLGSGVPSTTESTC